MFPTPIQVLAFLLVLTAIAVIIDTAKRRRRARVLRALAAQWRMTYTPLDSLRITSEVAKHFPVVGASNVFVRDLIYGTEGSFYRYIFTVEYIVGVVRSKHRHVRVAAFLEPRDRNQPSDQMVTLAVQEGALIDQYRQFAPESRKPKVGAGS